MLAVIEYLTLNLDSTRAATESGDDSKRVTTCPALASSTAAAHPAQPAPTTAIFFASDMSEFIAGCVSRARR